MDIRPVVLELAGGAARLEPLAASHAPGLAEVGCEESIWRWWPVKPMRSRADAEEMVARALAAAEKGAELPFAIVERATGRAIGSTRYLDVQKENRALEVGATWVAPPWQRTAVNTECKYLLLRHAFEALRAVRVQLKTDARNERSRAAILRIGGEFEGVLRKSRVLHDGYIRDTAYFSVIAGDWPAVKGRLEGLMGRGTGGVAGG